MGRFHDIDLHAIARDTMFQYGFDPHFSKEVIQKVQSMSEEAELAKEISSLPDLRHLLWSSIDNGDTLDLDQIEYCKLMPNGDVNVKIGIADVDAFVTKDDLIDLHAAKNTSSVYTGIETFPMLPVKLSTNLTSLKQDEDRVAVIIEYSVPPDGNIHTENIYRATVRNQAKLAYNEIGDYLEGKTDVPESVMKFPGLEEQLKLQNEAAERLISYRMEHGSLELNTREALPIVKNNKITAMTTIKHNKARDLIENFMVAANRTMVNFIEKANTPLIQRIVREPKEWDRIRQIAFEHNEILPNKPDAKALQQFLFRQRNKNPERYPDLSLTIVKLLGSGEYVMIEPDKKPYGHFGLAVTDYTHATAPNRRYVDVIIQRIVKSILANRKNPYSEEELVELSMRCTQREKSAKKVERFMRKAAAAALLDDKIGKIFEGIITGASCKGYYARIIDPPVEGRVHSKSDDLFVGQKIKVRLKSLDPYQGHIDFESIQF
ncbi:MAG TPA: ribonuclease II [Lentisphaeria bacterium]|nr:MAG: ribonuclease II [Lentisphaerae bacterium GWF2_38_69]HBM17108.1 ribonuclease II [Lentisphaeria bacterium]